MKFITKNGIIFIIILFLKFFSFNRAGIVFDALQLAAGTYLTLLFLYMWINGKLMSSYFSYPVYLFIFCIFFSATGAYFVHGQGIGNTLVGNKAFYIYLLFPALLYYRISEESIVKIVKFFFFAALIIYAVDFAMLPSPLFYWRMDIRRGGVSIFFYGRAFLILGSFYYLYKYLLGNKLVHLVLYIVGTITVLLILSRMLIAGMVLGTGMMLLHFGKRQIKYLFISFFVALVIAMVAIVFFKPTLDKLVDLTTDQYANQDDDARSSAIPFFLTEYQSNAWSRIFGNGIPANSAYRDYYKMVSGDKKARIGDVGLIGVWIYFGIFAVISWLMIFHKIYLKKAPPHTIFIRAYFVCILVEIFSGFAPHNPEYMPTTIIALYWFELRRLDMPKKKKMTRNASPALSIEQTG